MTVTKRKNSKVTGKKNETNGTSDSDSKSNKKNQSRKARLHSSADDVTSFQAKVAWWGLVLGLGKLQHISF